MRRHTLGLITTVLIVGLLTSMAAAQTQLEYWFDGTPAQVDFMEKAAAEYNNLQDNVIIKVVHTPETRERMATALAGGRGPDLLWYNHNVPWFFGIEAVHPLNDFINDPEIGITSRELFAAIRHTVHYGGVVQALPVTTSPGGTVYNRRHFADAGLSDDDAPRSWLGATSVAMKLTQRVGDRTTQWGITTPVVDWMLKEIMLTNGGDWVNDDLTEYAPTTDELAEGLQWFYDLIHTYEVMPMARGVSWSGSSQMLAEENSFAIGQASMQIGSITTYIDALDMNPSLDIGGVLNPLGPSANGRRKISPGFSGFYVMADSDDPRETYLFAKWFFQEKALDYNRVADSLPILTKSLQDPYWRDHKIVGEVLQAMMTAELRSFHLFPGRLDVRKEEPGMAEAVLLGIKSPKQAVADFKMHADRVFNDWEDEFAEFRAAHEIVW